MRLWHGILTLACAGAVAGCGGSETPPAPRLDAAVGARLAASADAVEAAASRGDSCAAVDRAQALQREAIAAVNAGDVPPALQEELLAGVNRLAASLECTPPPPPPASAPPPPAAPPPVTPPPVEQEDGVEDEHDGGGGKGKGKGKDKKGKKGRG